MLRMFSVSLLALGGIAGLSETAQAQVFVRAPFVRVWVGGPGVQVRAPFVNLWIPGLPPPPVFYVPPPVVVPGPQPGVVPVPQPMPPAETPPPPQAQPKEEFPPAPKPIAENPLTMEAFAKSFKAQAGNFQVSLINPVNNSATPVRFTLPEGTPKRVLVRQESIEFVYGPRRFVRIQFDEDGAIVTSR